MARCQVCEAGKDPICHRCAHLPGREVLPGCMGMAARGECTCGPSSNERLTAARAEGYAEGRAAERADMLAFVEEACRLGTQGDALLRALMAKGKHEGAASIVAKKGTP
jgi:hypothetical protein